jgi:hypothetical protein
MPAVDFKKNYHIGNFVEICLFVQKYMYPICGCFVQKHIFLLWEDPEAGVPLSFVVGRRRYVRQVRRRICSTNKSSVYGERKFCEMSWGKSAKADDYTKQ